MRMRNAVLGALTLLAGASWAELASGLAVGANTPAHHPQHVTGPDAGTDTCPV